MKGVVAAAGALLLVSIVVSVFLQSRFRRSLKREAPDLHAALWGQSRPGAPVRTRMVLPFMMLIYLRRYRTQLAPYPASRAWASWIFANQWLQAALVGVIIFVTLGK